MKNIFLIYVLLAFVLGTDVGAQDFVIKNLDVDIQMLKNGTLIVSENYDIYFYEKRRGIFRDIPFEFETENGTKIRTELSNIVVPNHKNQVKRKKGIANIRIGDPNKYITGDQHYEIRYQVARPFVRYEDRTEVLWNISGHHWPTQIQKFSYSFSLPDDFIMPDQDIRILTGKLGQEDLGITSFQKSGRTISGTTSRPLDTGEGVTLALNLPEDYLDFSASNADENKDAQESDPNAASTNEKSNSDQGYWIVGIIGALFGWMFKKYGRNAHVSEIRETYYPPEGMSAAEVGTFFDFTPNTRDLISLIPKWGHEGIVAINSIEGKDGKRDIYFDKKKEISPNAPEYEKTMFDGLFNDNTQVFLTDLKEKYYTILATAKSQVKKAILDDRLYDQTAKKYFHSIWNVIAGVLMIPLAIFIMIKFHAIFSGVLLIILGMTVMIIKFLRPKLSPEGQELHNRMEALNLFLKNPNPEKINELMDENPNYLDFIFPYVVAFGLDKTWNNAMIKTTYADYTPAWYMYHDPSGNREKSTYTNFSQNFDIPQIQSVFSSAPVSTTGGSGGFSGGTSGGGFGGGGGGSW